MRRLTVLLLSSLFVFASCWIQPTLAQTAGSPSTTIKVHSAKRGEVYSSFGSSLAPTNRATDAILLLDIDGISVEQFQGLAKDTVFVMAGERKCIPGIMTSGSTQPVDADGKPTGPVKHERLIAVVVPRDVLDFTLHVGGAQVPFKADRSIAPTLP